MADAGLAVAIDSVFDHVEADERDETGGHEGYEGANPRGGVNTTIVAKMEGDSAGGGEIAEEDGE